MEKDATVHFRQLVLCGGGGGAFLVLIYWFFFLAKMAGCGVSVCFVLFSESASDNICYLTQYNQCNRGGKQRLGGEENLL